jgi:predicted cupin superfamily sugar epimerase
MPLEKDASYWVAHLGLRPHPEGGYFREVYRCSEGIAQSALPQRFSGDRSFCTSIFYLLEKGDFSAFHRIKSDETWHFYAGGALEVVMLSHGGVTTVTLGHDIALGQQLQYTVPAEVWFASRPPPGTLFSLVGCMVSPGFDFADFEMASRTQLIEEFPFAQETVKELTRA